MTAIGQNKFLCDPGGASTSPMSSVRCNATALMELNHCEPLTHQFCWKQLSSNLLRCEREEKTLEPRQDPKGDYLGIPQTWD